MQITPAAEAAWSAVAAADPAGVDRLGVAELLRSIEAVRAVCDAAEVLAVRRTRELSAAGTSEPAEHVLVTQTGRSSRSARDATTRENACAAMPVLEDGLASGTISAGHLDVVAATHARLPDDVAQEFAGHAEDLARRSQQVGVDDFDRECRDLARHLTAINDPDAEGDELERQRAASSVKRWVDRTTGMHNTLISLDPLRDSMMWKVINHQVGRERQRRTSDCEPSLPFAAMQAQAFVAAVTNTADTTTGAASAVANPPVTPVPATGSSGAGSAPTGSTTPSSATVRLPEISILCDLDTLVTGIRATGGICESDDGTALPPQTIRRLACDASIIPIVLGSSGEVLDQGRKVRTATPAQRSTLAAMHRGCAYPGCTVGFSSCRIHHVEWWWEHYGPTNIDNLLPVCEKHHHLLHEGGWSLVLDRDRTATWSRPDGSIYHHGTTLDRRPESFPLRR